MADLTAYMEYNLPSEGGDDNEWGGYLNANWEVTDAKFSEVDNRLDNMGKTIIDLLYPVGALYISTKNENPSDTFNHGTWVAYAAGRALVGVGTADGTEWAGAQERGSATHTLTEAQMPQHNHSVGSYSGTFTTGGNNRGHTHATNIGSANTSSDTHNHGGSTNAGGRHNHEFYRTLGGSGANQQALGGPERSDFPRFYSSSGSQMIVGAGGSIGNTLYTAGARNESTGSSHSHSFTTDYDTHNHSVNFGTKTSGGESQNHNHAVTVSFSAKNTSNAGSGNAHNNIQPSIAIYVWERTA